MYTDTYTCRLGKGLFIGYNAAFFGKLAGINICLVYPQINPATEVPFVCTLWELLGFIFISVHSSHPCESHVFPHGDAQIMHSQCSQFDIHLGAGPQILTVCNQLYTTEAEYVKKMFLSEIYCDLYRLILWNSCFGGVTAWSVKTPWELFRNRVQNINVLLCQISVNDFYFNKIR